MRCPRLHLGAAFLLALCGHEARADPRPQEPAVLPPGYHVQVWSTAEGLPQNSVNGIVQTGRGELWLATFGGLSRFDGVRFQRVDIDSSPDLPSQRVTALVLDREGGFWVATQDAGLARFRDGRVVERVEPPPGRGELVALALDGEQQLWVRATNGELHRRANGAWSQPFPSAIPGRYGTLLAAPDGTLWIAQHDELLHVDPTGAVLQRARAPSAVACLALDGAGSCWLGLSPGLARFREQTLEIFETPPALDSAPAAILPIDVDHVWVGGSRGPVLLARRGSAPRFAQVPAPPGLPPDFSVTWILRDREGIVWMGSGNRGLARLAPHISRHIRISTPPKPAKAFVDDGAGGCWIAAECDGLARVDRSGELVLKQPLPKVKGQTLCANSLLLDSRGRLWIGSVGRVFRRDGEAIETLPFDLGIAGALVIAEDSNGSIWIADTNGLLRELGAGDELLSTQQLEDRVVTVRPAADGSLWIGGPGALLHLAHGVLTRFGAEHGIPLGDVRDVSFDSDGGIWIAAYGGGLGYLKDGRARLISGAQGLPDTSLTRILEDGAGRLWLLSNTGLIVVPRSELLEVLEGTRRTLDPVVLGPEAGIDEANYGSPAGFEAADGSMVLGTIRGGARVEAARFPFNRVPPQTRIEQLASDGRALDLAGPARVPPGTRRLRFDFTAFALAAPERVHFRHRLEGFDPRWIDAGAERSAEYSSLAPGSYALEVVARNEHGVWSTEPARLEFEVLPTWWQMPWVQAAGLALLLLGFIALHRGRVAAVHRRGAALLAATEGRRRAEERESRMRDELAHIARVATASELATSLAHEVNQPLAVILLDASAGRRYLEQEPLNRAELAELLDEITVQGERAAEVIRRLRDFLQKHSTEREPVALVELVRRTQPLVRRELDEHGVRLEVELAPDLPLVHADSVQLQQVLVNLIKNACEAMAKSAPPRKLVLSASRVDSRVEIHVRDNGPGLAPGVAGRLFEPFVTTKAAGMGLGLAICRTIVEAHGGRLSAFPAEGGGAVFKIELPVQSPP